MNVVHAFVLKFCRGTVTRLTQEVLTAAFDRLEAEISLSPDNETDPNSIKAVIVMLRARVTTVIREVF